MYENINHFAQKMVDACRLSANHRRKNRDETPPQGKECTLIRRDLWAMKATK